MTDRETLSGTSARRTKFNAYKARPKEHVPRVISRYLPVRSATVWAAFDTSSDIQPLFPMLSRRSSSMFSRFIYRPSEILIAHIRA